MVDLPASTWPMTTRFTGVCRGGVWKRKGREVRCGVWYDWWVRGERRGECGGQRASERMLKASERSVAGEGMRAGTHRGSSPCPWLNKRRVQERSEKSGVGHERERGCRGRERRAEGGLVVFGLIESIGDDCSSDPLDKDPRRETRDVRREPRPISL